MRLPLEWRARRAYAVRTMRRRHQLVWVVLLVCQVVLLAPRALAAGVDHHAASDIDCPSLAVGQSEPCPGCEGGACGASDCFAACAFLALPVAVPMGSRPVAVGEATEPAPAAVANVGEPPLHPPPIP